jgi:asparagine synthase (glutamine-hydrolysing)
MLRAIVRRGPDGEGQWQSPDGNCWLGHRRLAIIDLATGQQPMSNEDGSVWTVFNGEIYNYRTLRAELIRCGHRFHTSSDTEVLVHGYEQWGGAGLAERLQGIFAFAIYDRRNRRLYLARDHLGVKPLYWWTDGDVLLFGSEIKSLLPYPGLRARKVNMAGVAQFLVCRYVSRPHTMFEGIHKLPEGTWMEVDVGQAAAPQPRVYWDVRYQPTAALSFDDAKEQLDGLLKRTIQMQLMSDVPLGAQLSGGVDSSVIVAMMDILRRESGVTEPIKTFSVGFDVERFSELRYARMIAERYGTEHEEIRVGYKDFIDAFPLLCWIYDEPIGEPPAIPTYFMCKKAKEKVTVMLCGEGADEQFGGYSKYAFDQYSRYIDWLPARARRSLLRGAGATLPFSARRLRSIFEILALSDRASRFTSWYGAFDTAIQAQLLNADLREAIGNRFLTEIASDVIGNCDSNHPLDQFMYCDIHTRLVDDLLVKSDRMSMGASIEARVPFLDHHVVEFAARLPRRYKVNGLRTKILLKSLAERYAPRELIYRRKVGFTVPLSDWFVGPLRSYVRDVLLSDRCLARGYWRPEVLIATVNNHLDRKVDREQGIWVLLALELWHRLYVDNDGAESAIERVKEDMQRSLLRAAA